MKNKDLIYNFIIGYSEGKGSNLYIEGDCLVNYSTVIAKRSPEGLLLNARKYSVTTSKNQTYIRQIAKELGIEPIEYV